MKSVTVALLAYKEAENLRVLLPKIIDSMGQIGAEYEILVVDTYKPLDDTPEVCASFGARYVNQKGKGFADAFVTAIENARKQLFLIMDSDGSHNPEYIPAIYRKYQGQNCDIVIGSRYVEGGKTFDSKTSIAMSHILNSVFRVALGIKAKDISTDYRLYDTAQLKKVDLRNQNYDVLQEVLLKLRLNKPDLKIEEVPITFEKRKYGESKRRLIPFIIDYIKSLFRLTAMRVREERLFTKGSVFRGVFVIVLLAMLSCWLVGIFQDGMASRQMDLFFQHMNDYVADFTNVIGYSAELDPYHNLVYTGLGEKAYPPLTYLGAYLFSRLVNIQKYYDANYFLDMYCERLLQFMFILLTAATLLLLYEGIRHHLRAGRACKVAVALVMLFSRPVLYSIERGNTILLTLWFVMLFVLNYNNRQRGKREWACVALAVAASLKMTPAVLGVLLLLDRKDWKLAVRTVIYGLIAFLLPFVFLKGNLMDNVKQMFENVSMNLSIYSNVHGCTFEACLQSLGIMLPGGTVRLISYALAALLLGGCLFYPRRWMKVMAVSLLLVVIPAHSEDYCVLYLLPALVLFLSEKEHQASDWLILLASLLVLQPFQADLFSRPLNVGLGLLLLCAMMVLKGIFAAFTWRQAKARN